MSTALAVLERFPNFKLLFEIMLEKGDQELTYETDDAEFLFLFRPSECCILVRRIDPLPQIGIGAIHFHPELDIVNAYYGGDGRMLYDHREHYRMEDPTAVRRYLELMKIYSKTEYGIL